MELFGKRRNGSGGQTGADQLCQIVGILIGLPSTLWLPKASAISSVSILALWLFYDTPFGLHVALRGVAAEGKRLEPMRVRL